MALERALKRLSLESSSVCRQCRRTFASSPPSRQQQSATGAVSDLIQSSRAQNQTTTAAPYRGQTPMTNNPRSPGSEAAPATSTSPTIARQQQASPNTANDVASNLITATDAANRRQASSPNLAAEVNRISYRKDLESQQSRRWRSGDVYAPHDLSGVEMAKWKRVKQKARPRWDVLDQLNIKPMDHYKNFSIMSEYVTEMGRIKHSRDTGLRPRNHRKMAKAVRRAIGLGLIPSTYRHPEILKTEPDYKRRMFR